MPKKLLANPLKLLLICTSIVSFLFFLWGIDSWKFSFVGDEWSFYIFAKNLVEQPSSFNPLSFNGVYGTHSPLVSIYQSFFMQLFGINNFSWRLSNIILIFPISFFFYQWIKITFNKEIAVIATILLQFSFFLANFFKIGYDNPISFALLTLCLYLAARFGSHPTKKIGFWLGVTLGISFYTYFGAAFPLFIWPYLLPLRKKLGKSATKQSLLVGIIMYLAFIFPLFFQVDSVQKVIFALGSPSSFHLKKRIFWDLLLFYQNHDYFYNHFITGPYLDRISQVFCIIGTLIVLLEIRQRPYRYLLLSYISIVIFIGSTSPDWFSPATRGIFFILYGMVFTGLGIGSIKVKDLSITFYGIILSLIILVNVYQSQIGTFTGKNADYTGMSLIMRSLQQANTTHTPITLLLSPSQTINQWIWTLPYMIQAYGLSSIRFTIVYSDNFFCSQSAKNSTIIVLQQDTYAIKKLQNSYCGYPLNYTVLSPTITVF